MEETKRWSDGVVGFGSGSDPAELLQRMQRDMLGYSGLMMSDGLPPIPPDPPSSIPAPVLNRRQRREAARLARRRR